MSPELQRGESLTELGLRPKDSEERSLRGLAEDLTPTLFAGCLSTPSVRKDVFSPLPCSNSGWRTKLCGSKQVSPLNSIMNDYGLLRQCSFNVHIKRNGRILAAHFMNACSESRVIVPLFLNLSARCRWLATFTHWSPYYLERTPAPIV
jgi:hypothetical protein